MTSAQPAHFNINAISPPPSGPSDPTTAIEMRHQKRARASESHSDDDNDDNDNTDGGRSEALKNLLSSGPGAAIVGELASEVVARLVSAERTRDLAGMSRGRYAVTQCVTIVVAVLALLTVCVVTLFSANTGAGELLSELLQRALNRTDTSNATARDAL